MIPHGRHPLASSDFGFRKYEERFRERKRERDVIQCGDGVSGGLLGAGGLIATAS